MNGFILGEAKPSQITGLLTLYITIPVQGEDVYVLSRYLGPFMDI